MGILILVCAAALSQAECRNDTALHVFHAPPVEGGLVNCMREGMLYAANSRLVTPGTYMKIACRAPGARTAGKLG